MSKESKEVLRKIEKYGPIRAVELVKMLNVSTKTVYKHLTKLLDEELIEKTGTTPRVFYMVKEKGIENEQENDDIFNIENQIIEQEYIYVSPDGKMHRGQTGFQLWCKRNNLKIEKEKKLFIKGLKAIQKIKKDGLISAKKTILSGKERIYLDNIYFSNFYTFDHFGKTKLGQLVYLGKSSQNKELISEIAQIVKPSIQKLIKKYNIKAVCFIPPTIDRKIQFLDALKQKLKLDLVEVKAVKVDGGIKVPQKTLRKLEDRIINAKTTITVNPNQKIDGNILIIDDATGSGATLNETAKKIRNITTKNTKIIGYSVIGSYKGFDVISEV